MKKQLMMILALGMLGATASLASDTTAEKPAEAVVEKTAVETVSDEGEPSKWTKANKEVREAVHAVGDATADSSKKVWGATKEESVEVWDKAKSKSKEIWKKSKAKVHDVTASDAEVHDVAAPDTADVDAADVDAADVDAVDMDAATDEAQPLENN